MNNIVKIESHLPAASFELDGKCWLACGANWIEVDHVYSAEELKQAWVYKKPVYDVPQKPNLKNGVSYQVVGSTGKIYEVKEKDGKWTCDCPAASFNRFNDCKRIKQVKQTQTKTNKQ